MPIGTYTPPSGKSITQFFFFHFRCILLQISHQKCFFISISIPGRSGVKYTLYPNSIIALPQNFDLKVIVTTLAFLCKIWNI